MPATPATSGLAFRSEILTNAGYLHGFSSALGGADYALGLPETDLRLALEALGREVGFDPSKLYQVKQVHGVEVHLAEGDPRELVGRPGDAVVARTPAHVAGVRVADCVPVLVGAGRHVAAIHAGWRGVDAGIVGIALAELSGADRVAAIGPCIGACCFEVSVEVADRLVASVGHSDVVVSRYGEGKAKVDLRRAVRHQLRAAGALDSRIDDVGGCTRCGGAAYHSYRRDGDRSGRMLAVIVAT